MFSRVTRLGPAFCMTTPDLARRGLAVLPVPAGLENLRFQILDRVWAAATGQVQVLNRACPSSVSFMLSTDCVQSEMGPCRNVFSQ